MSYLSKNAVITRLRYYIYLKNQLMEFLGGWVQFIPDIDVKVQFGFHIYADARHSDLMRERLSYLGARTEEKQMAIPAESFVRFLERLWNESTNTQQRIFIASVFLREKLIDILRRQLHMTSVPEDKATEEIVEMIIQEDGEHIQWANEKLHDLNRTGNQLAESWKEGIKRAYDGSGGFMRESEGDHYHFKKIFSYSRMPARPAHFTVIEDAGKYDEKAQTFETLEGKKRLIHDLINGEFITVERLGRMLAEFPEQPWEMRFEIAKQVWDEARHGETLIRRLREFGAGFGDYPLNYWGWEVDVNRPDPLERLAISNTVFESEASKYMNHWIAAAHKTGDEESARLLEFLLMDEVTHVQLGRKWIDELTKNDPDRRKRVLEFPEHILASQRPKGIILAELTEGESTD